MSKLSLEDESTKPTGSKEEYKYYVKEIVHVLQGKGLGVTQMSEIVEELRQTIMERDRQFREKYQFSEGIPNWELFLAVVVNIDAKNSNLPTLYSMSGSISTNRNF